MSPKPRKTQHSDHHDDSLSHSSIEDKRRKKQEQKDAAKRGNIEEAKRPHERRTRHDAYAQNTQESPQHSQQLEMEQLLEPCTKKRKRKVFEQGYMKENTNQYDIEFQMSQLVNNTKRMKLNADYSQQAKTTKKARGKSKSQMREENKD